MRDSLGSRRLTNKPLATIDVKPQLVVFLKVVHICRRQASRQCQTVLPNSRLSASCSLRTQNLGGGKKKHFFELKFSS